MRLFWMKLHAYLACFFLPFTILYLATGVLHLFDIHGDYKNIYEYEVPLSKGWPEQELVAKDFVLQLLSEKGHLPVPEFYYGEENMHDWYGRTKEVVFIPTDDPAHAKIIIKEHDFWKQLLFIHKGIAGKIFWILGLLFGLHLLISAISGVVMVLKMPALKSTSMLSLSAGFALLVILLLT